MKNIRRGRLPVLLMAGILGLTACNGAEDGGAAASTDDGNGSAQSPAGEEPIVLVVGHPGPETEEAMEEFADAVSELSDGRLKIDAFPASVLGSAEEMIEGLSLRSTDIVVESLVGIEPYTDLATIESVPFLYESDEEFLEIWNGEIGDTIRDQIADESDFRLLGSMYRGARELTTKEPVEQLSDLAGKTIRTPSAPIMMETWELLGARAEALPYTEVYSAIESGVIDGQENPLGTIQALSFYEVAPHIAETNHIRMNYYMIRSDARFQELDVELQDALAAAAEKVSTSFSERTIADNDEFRTSLEEGGAEFHELKDPEAWVEATEPVLDGLPEVVRKWVETIRSGR